MLIRRFLDCQSRRNSTIVYGVCRLWVLVGQNGGCVVPSEAEGSNQLFERLQQLFGFANEAAIRAAQCIDEQLFLCWEKKA